MVQRAADFGFAPVHVCPEMFEPDGVAREDDRPRQIRNNEPRIGQAKLAVGEGDEPVHRRIPHGATNADLRIRAAGGPCRGRERTEQSQVQCGVCRELEGLRAAKQRAATQDETVVATSPFPVSDVDASVANDQARRPLLIERHAGQRQFRAGERHASIHAVERRCIGLKRDRCIDPALELFECGWVRKRGGDPGRQR